MSIDDIQAIVAVGFLFLIIACQAALNLWFIFKNETLTKASGELRILADELKKTAELRTEEMQAKIAALERNIGARLDANIELLERMVVPPPR